jgi:predicted O-methyltransferase YrrM
MFPITTALMIMMLIMVSLYSLHKLKSVHLLLHQARDNARADASNNFQQLEALQGLYIELDLARSLPPTRGWAASPDFLMVLTRHALKKQPALVVECSSGISTLVLARCMQMNGRGKVISLENDPNYARKTREQLALHGLDGFAEVIDAPLVPFTHDKETYSWYAHAALASTTLIDMLVIDGPPMTTGKLARYPAGPALFHRLSADAAVFLDDASRPDEKTIVQRWVAEHPALQAEWHDCEKGCTALYAGSHQSRT